MDTYLFIYLFIFYLFIFRMEEVVHTKNEGIHLSADHASREVFISFDLQDDLEVEKLIGKVKVC